MCVIRRSVDCRAFVAHDMIGHACTRFFPIHTRVVGKTVGRCTWYDRTWTKAYQEHVGGDDHEVRQVEQDQHRFLVESGVRILRPSVHGGLLGRRAPVVGALVKRDGLHVKRADCEEGEASHGAGEENR